jgi:hypothetical protein
MQALSLRVDVERLPFASPFRISGFTFEALDVVVVTLDDGSQRGRGEAAGVYYLGDNAPQMVAAIEAQRGAIERGVDRAGLQRLLPAGGARNAVDCALWELDARRAGKEAWELAGLPPPKPLLTTFTLGADAPAAMAERAAKYTEARALKLKLTGELELDSARVRAVRQARPGTWIGVDANQGYEIGALDALIEMLVTADVALLEQPLKRGREADLDGYSLADPDRGGRELPDAGRSARPGRPLRRRQHQARQVRRPDRGTGDGARGAPARPLGHGRQHGGHEPRHGPGLRGRPALRHRRPRRPDLPRQGSRAVDRVRRGRGMERTERVGLGAGRHRVTRVPMTSAPATPSWFQRFLLPGFAFKAVVIGGGYATGRELAEFFMPSGPWGGVAAMVLAMVIWCAVCVATFLFARATHTRDYLSFFRELLGPGWVVFEGAYVLFVVLILAVFGAAAGAIGEAMFGVPRIVGTLALMVGIAGFTMFGSVSVERLFKYVSFLLYACTSRSWRWP